MKNYTYRTKNDLRATAPTTLEGGTIRFGGPVSTFVSSGKFFLWGPDHNKVNSRPIIQYATAQYLKSQKRILSWLRLKIFGY